MSPLLVVIVTFGLIFTVSASLAQGFAMPIESFKEGLAAHTQLDVMLLLSNSRSIQPTYATPSRRPKGSTRSRPLRRLKKRKTTRRASTAPSRGF